MLDYEINVLTFASAKTSFFGVLIRNFESISTLQALYDMTLILTITFASLFLLAVSALLVA
jgi:asparagine N-glycosylation enzyme membrane subunit Stt3